MDGRLRLVVALGIVVCAALAPACDSGGGGDEPDDSATDSPDATDVAVDDGGSDGTPDETPDVVDDVPTEDAPPADVPTDDAAPPDDGGTETDGGGGYVDELGTNNQDIVGVQRVIFMGDSITATYIPPSWPSRIRDDLQGLFGAGIEIVNLAVPGARTEHLLEDQIPRIDTSSTARTLVLFTIGGNDALQVIGDDIPSSLAHMETKRGNLRAILDWFADPANFPGGVYVVFSNLYDPTDGEGDFTHCGIGVAYEDWPDVDELATTVNGWYLEEADARGFDVLNAHDLFLGHGWNSNDASSPYYCYACDPDCPCARWLDWTCIHPNADGHEALAGYFFDIVAR